MTSNFITDERLNELVKRIRPVVRFIPKWMEEGNKLQGARTEADRIRINKIPREKAGSQSNTGIPYVIKLPRDLRRTAYTWDPEPEPGGMAEGIEQYAHIITYHTFGAPSLFKPSVAEVLAQIPEALIETTVAFELRTEDLTCVNVSSFHNAHWAPCILYRVREGCEWEW